VTDFIKKTNEELILNKPNPKNKKSNFKEIKELKDISLILKNNVEKIVQYKFPFIIKKGKSAKSVHQVITEIISQDYGFILSEIKTVIANYMKDQPPLGITYFKECINPSRIIKASINTNNTLIDIFSQLREEETIECFSKILFLMLKEGFICTFKESTALSENQKHNIQQHYFKDVLKLKNTNINENEQIVVNYDFDRSLIDNDDYLYVETEWFDPSDDGNAVFASYDVYFFDVQTNTLYYFHNNI
jgi:hypothetical protein